MNATRAFSAEQEEFRQLRGSPRLRRSYLRAPRFSTGATPYEALRESAARTAEAEADPVYRGELAELEQATMTFRVAESFRLRALATEARQNARRAADALLSWDAWASSAPEVEPSGFQRWRAERSGPPLARDDGEVPAADLRPALRGAPALSTFARDALARREGLRDLEDEFKARARWYESRAAAQLSRFASVRACGSQGLRVSCRVCGDSPTVEAIPCRCGVVRVCEECADAKDAQRRKRIAKARLAAMSEAGDRGYFERSRHNGAWSEKMLTLTVPHVDLADVRGAVRDECVGLRATTVAARCAALRLAWPKFWRTVRRYVTRRERSRSARVHYFRLWEWTRGHDGKGHPHFHVYLLSPFLDLAFLRRAWASALEAVGMPCPTECKWCAFCEPGAGECDFGRGAPHAVVDIRQIKGFNWHALRELVKLGDRKMIEDRLGVLRSAERGGLDAIDYAAAWTLGDAFADVQLLSAADVEAQRDLYIATEGRRLCQGSRGFLLPPLRPVCSCCGQSAFSAGVEFSWQACHEPTAVDVDGEKERGPPCA